MIRLHVGQCGNGIGKALLEQEEKSPLTALQQALIFVDSEPRVVRGVLSSSSQRDQRRHALSTAAHTTQDGCGNNWALGFHSQSSCKLYDATLESLRKQMEYQDVFYGVHLFHSLSGGTGTGLSSRLIRGIRDEFGADPYLVSTCVAPFDVGDTPLQHYNAALTLGTIQPACDALIWSSNAELHREYKSLPTINQYIARCHLAQANNVPQFMRNAVAIPTCNFVEIWAADTWDALKKIVPKPSNPQWAASVQCQLIAHGSALRRYKRKDESLFDVKQHKSILRMCKPVAWNPDCLTIIEKTKPSSSSSSSSSSLSKAAKQKDKTTVSVALNRARVIEYLSRVVEKTEAMFKARAYWHWYEQYGCDDLILLDALERLKIVQQDYHSMCL